MKQSRIVIFLLCTCFLYSPSLFAQDENEEEDYSIYDDLEFADESAKRFANVKVNGKSPDKLISIGYDVQGAYDLDAAAFRTFNQTNERVLTTQGFRFDSNIPIVSRNSIIIQGGLSYWNTQYTFENPGELTHPLHQTLSENGLNTLQVSSTIYKPLNETSFLLTKVSAAMSGDYQLSNFQNPRYNRYSVAVLWGKKPNDFKQWAVGLSRTYLAGELNYIPVFMYNWTSTNRKWGIETLLPARGDVRYNFSQRSMMFFGFDLEGTSYRIGNNSEMVVPFNDLEIRRSELRFRVKYERQLSGFMWVSAKLGYRQNYTFNVDRAEGGRDFFRGFFGDQAYVMENRLTNPLFFNISLNLVSP